MNKKLMGVALIITVAVAGGFVYLLANSKPATEQTAQQPPKAAPTAPADTPASPQGPGSYKDYSDDAVATATGTKILFFYAPWCPQCRALEDSIQQGTIPSGVTIFKVDYDSATALKQKYGVTLQTTLVKIDDNGNKIGKAFVAYYDHNLAAVIREFNL